MSAVDCLYEDAHLLVLHKPSGLLSVPGRVPPEACRAALVLMSLAAGLPVPPVPPVAPAAC